MDEITKQEEPKQKTIDDLTVTELKALAFDLTEQSKTLQNQYNIIMKALSERVN